MIISITIIVSEALPSNPGLLYLKQFLHEVASQILLVSVRRVLQNVFHCALRVDNRRRVAEEAWVDLFLLSASRWPVDIAAMAVATHSNFDLPTMV